MRYYSTSSLTKSLISSPATVNDDRRSSKKLFKSIIFILRIPFSIFWKSKDLLSIFFQRKNSRLTNIIYLHSSCCYFSVTLFVWCFNFFIILCALFFWCCWYSTQGFSACDDSRYWFVGRLLVVLSKIDGYLSFCQGLMTDNQSLGCCWPFKLKAFTLLLRGFLKFCWGALMLCFIITSCTGCFHHALLALLYYLSALLLICFVSCCCYSCW